MTLDAVAQSPQVPQQNAARGQLWQRISVVATAFFAGVFVLATVGLTEAFLATVGIAALSSAVLYACSVAYRALKRSET